MCDAMLWAYHADVHAKASSVVGVATVGNACMAAHIGLPVISTVRRWLEAVGLWWLNRCVSDSVIEPGPFTISGWLSVIHTLSVSTGR